MKKIIITILIIFSSTLIGQNEWKIWGTMENPVAAGKAVFFNGDIYISGGYSKETQDKVDWIQKIDPFFGNNEIVSHMKNNRYGHVAGSVNNKLVFLGGINDSGDINMSFEEFDIYNSDTTVIVASDTNFNRIFSTGISYINSFYIIGGNSYSDIDSSILSYIVEYDADKDSIIYKSAKDSIKVEFPEQQMSATIEDNIFIFGGVSNGVSQLIQRFNIATKKLDTLNISLLEPRAGGVAVPFGYNTIYIIGGFNEGNSALSSVEIFRLDGENYTINSGLNLNEARTNLMAVATYDQIFVLGGYNSDNMVLETIEVYGESTVHVNDEKSQTPTFNLAQNYPNPFNPTTIINYSLPEINGNLNSAQNVTLKIYDILGREVATLVDKAQTAGDYSVSFNANLHALNNGQNITSGIYFYKLQYGTFVKNRKMILIK
jgi:hypothetical protein